MFLQRIRSVENYSDQVLGKGSIFYLQDRTFEKLY